MSLALEEKPVHHKSMNNPGQLIENVKGSHERDKPQTPEEEQVLKECAKNFYANLTPEYRWLHHWEVV